ncbi:MULTISPECIES: YHS domain-containing protein [Halorussus]|uniref:YHS domain-containing protein n=1 Tax=Halorussus TaxID=1070314 RepID=UPI0020A11684|nr:YHS domain-containing protein [Halorussus vallis]USZ74617.1 YHS domain-containing protein [Halorussus vallis]
MAECPVCGMDVETTSPEETDYRDESFSPAQVEYEGETYEFCGEEHREAFEADPDEYV